MLPPVFVNVWMPFDSADKILKFLSKQKRVNELVKTFKQSFCSYFDDIGKIDISLVAAYRDNKEILYCEVFVTECDRRDLTYEEFEEAAYRCKENLLGKWWEPLSKQIKEKVCLNVWIG